jgi:tRNA (guanine-N7-)-methyltransferase
MLQRTTLQNGPHRPIRSFVERQGRISLFHRQILAQLWPVYGLHLTTEKLDLLQTFGRIAPVTLEIGFGDGRALLAQAQQHPEQNFIGIEVYKAGIAKLFAGIYALGLTNVRVFCADAIEVLTNCLEADSLDHVQLFFPDPWPKLRHHKRRIVQAQFVQLIAQKLRTFGTLHMATDWEEYALHMLAVLEAQAGWENTAGLQQFAERPITRPLTKFEQRGHRLGYGTWDLIFRKNSHTSV